MLHHQLPALSPALSSFFAMAALVGALGSVIGYLGTEVAETPIFDRLLFPARFYNDLTPLTLLKLTLLLPMGGPLHRAALSVLDTFRSHDLYAGSRRGTMLGTAFFTDSRLKYCASTACGDSPKKDARNAMWMRVMRGARPRGDGAGQRATQSVCQLSLRAGRVPVSGRVNQVREDGVTWRTIVGIICSELTAVGVALVAGLYIHVPWLAAFFMLPLTLKLLAAAVAVEREPLRPISDEDIPTEEVLFEVDDLVRGFFIIKGSEETVLQFFRHYAHPLRNSRLREIISIAVTYLFVLYFPTGLLALLWMDERAQYLWLSYQIYIIIAMHLVRVCGYEGCGRTEERLGRYLGNGETAWLTDSTGNGIVAVLNIEDVENVKAAKEKVAHIFAAQELC